MIDCGFWIKTLLVLLTCLQLGMQHVRYVHVWEENAASRLKFSWKKYIACVVYKLCVVWIYKFQIREIMSMKCVLVSVSCPGHLKSINLIANNITNTCAFYNVRSQKSGAVIYSAQPLFHCFPSFCEILALEWEVFPILCCRRPHLWHTVAKYFVCITFSNIRFLGVSLAVIA